MVGLCISHVPLHVPHVYWRGVETAGAGSTFVIRDKLCSSRSNIVPSSAQDRHKVDGPRRNEANIFSSSINDSTPAIENPANRASEHHHKQITG
jgi:hypothetical protein